jgi:hypothetical protein
VRRGYRGRENEGKNGEKRERKEPSENGLCSRE